MHIVASCTGRTRREPWLPVKQSVPHTPHDPRLRLLNNTQCHPTNTTHMSGDGFHTQTIIKHTREHRPPNGPNPLTPHINKHQNGHTMRVRTPTSPSPMILCGGPRRGRHNIFQFHKPNMYFLQPNCRSIVSSYLKELKSCDAVYRLKNNGVKTRPAFIKAASLVSF